VDLPSLHRSALDFIRPTIAAIAPEQMSLPTPCAGWDVRALLNHLVAGNYWAAELGAGGTIEDVGDRLDGDVLGDDPLEAYDASAKVAADAFDAPGAMQAPCAVSYGPVPGSVYCGHRLIDVLVHGWDLARATSQDTSLDPVLVDDCIEVAEPQRQALLASGAFGSTIIVPANAGAQTRLLAMLGREA